MLSQPASNTARNYLGGITSGLSRRLRYYQYINSMQSPRQNIFKPTQIKMISIHHTVLQFIVIDIKTPCVRSY